MKTRQSIPGHGSGVAEPWRSSKSRAHPFCRRKRWGHRGAAPKGFCASARWRAARAANAIANFGLVGALRKRPLAFERAQRAADARDDGVPGTAFRLRIDQVEAVDRSAGLTREIATAVEHDS